MKTALLALTLAAMALANTTVDGLLGLQASVAQAAETVRAETGGYLPRDARSMGARARALNWLATVDLFIDGTTSSLAGGSGTMRERKAALVQKLDAVGSPPETSVAAVGAGLAKFRARLADGRSLKLAPADVAELHRIRTAAEASMRGLRHNGN